MDDVLAKLKEPGNNGLHKELSLLQCYINMFYRNRRECNLKTADLCAACSLQYNFI